MNFRAYVMKFGVIGAFLHLKKMWKNGIGQDIKFILIKNQLIFLNLYRKYNI